MTRSHQAAIMLCITGHHGNPLLAADAGDGNDDGDGGIFQEQ